MFSCTEELAAKLKSVRYLVAEEMLPAIYLAMKLGRPLLIEGPPESGKTALASSVATATGTVVEKLQCYVAINEENAIGKFDEALQRLFMGTAENVTANGWDPLRTKSWTNGVVVNVQEGRDLKMLRNAMKKGPLSDLASHMNVLSHFLRRLWLNPIWRKIMQCKSKGVERGLNSFFGKYRRSSLA